MTATVLWGILPVLYDAYLEFWHGAFHFIRNSDNAAQYSAKVLAWRRLLRERFWQLIITILFILLMITIPLSCTIPRECQQSCIYAYLEFWHGGDRFVGNPDGLGLLARHVVGHDIWGQGLVAREDP